jgi:heme/copper-type cytochrome/quinol oxidase subunit 4
MFKTKKGQASFGGLNPQAILIGMAIMVLIVVIVVAFGLVFLANFDAQLTTIGTASGVNVEGAQTAVATGSTALGSIPGWLPLVILAFILLVILGLIALVAVVASSMQRGGQ